MRALIIEDEIRTARTLEKYLKYLDIEVVAIIPSVEEGIAFFQSPKAIDLIFSDIEISDGTCFDLFKEITLPCPVIFCTAYNQYALEAFRSNGIDYIVKPFSEDHIAEAIAKFRQLTHHGNAPSYPSDILEALRSTLQAPKQRTILVTFRDKTFPVDVSNIAYFFVEDETTSLYTNGHEYLLSKSLDELEAVVDASQFYRANRQFLINRAYIKEIEQFFARKLAIKLTVPVRQSIIVSKAKASDFIHWMEG